MVIINYFTDPVNPEELSMPATFAAHKTILAFRQRF